MKINLKKLTKLQEEFKEGNLLQNITAWDILNLIGREGGTISLHSLIKDMEEGDIYLEEDETINPKASTRVFKTESKVLSNFDVSLLSSELI